MVTAYLWIAGPSRGSVTASGSWSRAGNWIPPSAVGSSPYVYFSRPITFWDPTPGPNYDNFRNGVIVSCALGGNAYTQTGVTAAETGNIIVVTENGYPPDSTLQGRDGWSKTLSPPDDARGLAAHAQAMSAHKSAMPSAKIGLSYSSCLGTFKTKIPATDAALEAIDPNGNSELTAGDSKVATITAASGFIPAWAYAAVTVAVDGFAKTKRYYRYVARRAKQVRNAYGSSSQPIVLYVWWKALGSPFPHLQREDYRAFFEACVAENVDGAVLAKADDAAEAALVQVHYDASMEPGRDDAIGGVTPPASYWDGNGPWELIGGGVRTVRIHAKPFPASAEYRLELTDTTHNVKAVLFSGGSGLNCWEAGVEGINVIIRRADWGVPQVASATATHGVTSAVPFTLGVRVEGGAIKVYVNGQLKTQHTPTEYTEHTRIGFVSDVEGAEVTRAEFCELVPIIEGAASVLVAVCGGDVFMATSTDSVRKIAARAFKQSGPVSLDAIDQKIIGVDGQKCLIIDTAAETVTPFVPVAGELPGAEVGVPGSTTATIFVNHLGRGVFAGMKADPQNLLMSSNLDYLNLDTADLDNPGRAFQLTGATSGKIGQPIKALCSLNQITLLIGCESSFWRMVGEPALSIPLIDRAYSQSGVSGKDAMIRLGDGRGIAHSPDGLILLPASGEGINISQNYLTTGFNIPQADVDDYLVQVRLSPEMQALHVMRTPLENGPGQDFEYCVRVGGFAPGAPALFPIDFDESIEPTASSSDPWLGAIVWGTRDGRLVWFDRTANYSDVDEFAIPCRFALTPLERNPGAGDTIINHLYITPALESDATNWRIYAGRSTEEALLGADRWVLASGTLTLDTRRPVARKVRAPAIVVELSNDTLNENINIESVFADWSIGAHHSRRQRVAVPAPDQFCTAAVSGGEPTIPDPPATGPGAGGGVAPTGGVVAAPFLTTKILVVGRRPDVYRPSTFFNPRGITNVSGGGGPANEPYPGATPGWSGNNGTVGNASGWVAQNNETGYVGPNTTTAALFAPTRIGGNQVIPSSETP